MEFWRTSSAPEGRPNRDLGVEATPRARSVATQLGPNLVEGLMREAQELNLCHRHEPSDRHSQ